MRRAHVIIEESNGGIDKHPLKSWLRTNPEALPSGLHPDDNTSHQLRRARKKEGLATAVHTERGSHHPTE